MIALIGPAARAAEDFPVIDPVPAEPGLIRASDRDPLHGHVRATINEPFPRIIERSALPRAKFKGELHRAMNALDVVDPVRFSYTHDALGFTVPAAIRVHLNRRSVTFDGETLLPDGQNDLRVALIVVRKLPIYDNPEDALREAKAWNKRLQQLGYEPAEPHVPNETEASFLDQAHNIYDHGIGEDFPSFRLFSLRHEHIGIKINIQRSPHPERSGPEAHGFNIAIGIKDLRVMRL
jgi:hypothetical protein